MRRVWPGEEATGGRVESLNEQRADKNIGNYGIDADVPRAQQAYKKGRARPDVK